MRNQFRPKQRKRRERRASLSEQCTTLPRASSSVSIVSRRLTTLSFIPIIAALIFSCGTNQHVDSPAIDLTANTTQLKYEYPTRTSFNYQQKVERTSFGITTGEEHNIWLTCTNTASDRMNFIQVDSVQFIANSNNRFPAPASKVQVYAINPVGNLTGVKNLPLAEARTSPTLPRLPGPTMLTDAAVREDIPLARTLPANATVVCSYRERRMVDTAQMKRFEETILQIVKIDMEASHNEIDSTDELTRAGSTSASFDTLLMHRNILLSGPAGYLIHSSTSQRRVQFIRHKDSTADAIRKGNYVVNESYSTIDLRSIVARTR